mgnify:CR=1 FL=1|jgi:hypothetical protein
MRKSLLSTALLATAFNLGFAQSPDLSWTKHFIAPDMGLIKSIAPLPTGGYAIAGNKLIGTIGDNNRDFVVAVVDNYGNTKWSKIFGGPNYDYAENVKIDADGNLVVVGSIQSPTVDYFPASKGYYDVGVMKLDTSDGNVIWAKRYGGNMPDYGYSIWPTSDGGYLVGGTSASKSDDVSANNGLQDAWIFKLDADGTILWEKNFGTTANDYAYKAQETTDGGFVFFGTSSNDMWVVKVDASGNEEWNKKFGGTIEEHCYYGQQTSDGGYILCGYAKSSNGDFTTNAGEEDGWVLKLSASGTIEWKHTLASLRVDKIFSVKETEDGGFIYTGTSENKVYIMSSITLAKLSSSGTEVWNKTLQNSTDFYGYQMLDVIETHDDGYMLVGGIGAVQTEVFYGTLRPYFMKFGGTDNEGVTSIFSPKKSNALTLYPNPAATEFKVTIAQPMEIRIVNVLGETVLVQQAAPGESTIDVSGFAPGTYYVLAGNNSSGQLVVVK